MHHSFKSALCGALAFLASGQGQAALDEVARALETGKPNSALEQLEQLPISERQSAEGQLLYAEALAAKGEMAAAETRYIALIEQAPGQPEAYNNLAVLYARQGRLDEARELLERAMRTSDSYATVYSNLSNIYLAMSRSAYAKALQLERRPDGPDLQSLLAVADKTGPSAATQQSIAQLEVNHPAMAEPVAEPSVAAEETGSGDEAEAVSAAVEPEPEVAEPEPEPEVAEPEPEPKAVEPEPEPKTVEPEPEPKTVEPEAGEPVQIAAAEPEPSVDEKAEVTTAIQQWATAWAGQDVEGYLNAYDGSFKPNRGMSLSQWQQQRRARLSRPSIIEVNLSEIEVTLTAEGRAQVELVQAYRSDRYRDRTRKRFYLIRRDSGWKITSEKTIEVL